jgi:gliding motility-associated-like protein
MKFSPARYLLTVVALIFCNSIRAQVGNCPPNIDFEMGDFTNWTCEAGTVSVVGGVNTPNLVVTPPIPGRHTIISTRSHDPYGGFNRLCPNGSLFSVQLGNNSSGAQAEGVSYIYNIPATATSFSILFNYAVVLQNPNHAPEEQPRFRARIIDMTTNAPIPCVTFDFTSSSNLPGFQVSPVDPSVIYKDWTPVSINLSGLAGRTIKLEFITSDCTRGGHFGYAYLDVNSYCNGVISGNYICPGDTAITLTAPFGFLGYAWYSDMTFSTILSNNQTLHLIPPPAVGTTYPVIVSPYPTFGCVDTLYATIQVGARPVSNAGPDQAICKNQQVQIGGPPSPNYSYQWTPAAQVSDPIISNPLAWTLTLNPEQFIVQTTDLITGCSSYDTTIISTNRVDTSIRLTGKNEFCVGDLLGGFLIASRNVSAVQWYNNNLPIPGATFISYKPLASGAYWAQVVEGGCTDSTAQVNFIVHPLPLASFMVNSDTGCITRNSFIYTNSSFSIDNANLGYIWKLPDGTLDTSLNITRSYTPTGSYPVSLVTTTQFGCKDSTQQHTVYVLPNGKADFTWDSICVARPVAFYNLSAENASPLVKYNWNFNNGGPGSQVKNPVPVTYSSTGMTDVTLRFSALGCENFPDSITKIVQVNAAKAGYTYRSMTVPLGSSQYLHVRDSIGSIYSWRPQMQLKSYNTRYTEFYATQHDVKYLIDITDQHTCVTTDTIQMQILRKPGYYLPTAFTPNHDGLNDLLRPYLIGMTALKSFSIYNRNGVRVYYTEKQGEGWDGKFKGVDQETGVYIWVLEFYDAANNKVMEKGTVTLIR